VSSITLEAGMLESRVSSLVPRFFQVAGSLLLAGLLGCGGSGDQATPTVSNPVETGFVTKTLGGRAYAVYVPEAYNEDARKTWPLIVFQHGSGERGSDGTRQTQVGLGPQIQAHPDWFPCLVLFPQVDTNWNNPWEAQYEQILGEYRIDAQRVFMTGLSLGGMATWQAGASYPDRFAALMPLCAVTSVSPTGIANLAQAPIRTFIGDQDGIFSIPELQALVAAIGAQGGDIQCTIFPGVGHNCWDRVYSERANIDWLLSQSR
jgi:predicted peptidase